MRWSSIVVPALEYLFKAFLKKSPKKEAVKAVYESQAELIRHGAVGILTSCTIQENMESARTNPVQIISFVVRDSIPQGTQQNILHESILGILNNKDCQEAARWAIRDVLISGIMHRESWALNMLKQFVAVMEKEEKRP